MQSEERARIEVFYTLFQLNRGQSCKWRGITTLGSEKWKARDMQEG